MAYWDGYFSLAGVEFANEERFRTYVQNVGAHLPVRERDLNGYSGLHSALGDNPYSTPLADRAPWVDINNEVTHGFLGGTVLSMEGFDSSTRTADVIEGLGKGGAVGSSRESSRSIRMTMLLVGLSPEAVQEGITWLDRALWRSKNPRPLVPQQPGVSDLRFFEQRPDMIDGVNYVWNPSASKLGESLTGSASTAYAFRSLDDNDNWAYKITSRVTGNSTAEMSRVERPKTRPGQMWVASADIWRAAATGDRLVQFFIRFRDQYGNIIATAEASATSVPNGELYRWKGARYDSVSQKLTTDGMIQNFMVNPSAEGITNGLSPAGPGATVQLSSTAEMTGKKAYLMTATQKGEQGVVSRTAAAVEGQQWWGRAKGKLLTLGGARHMRADLAWLDRTGKEIGRSQGSVVDLVPSATFNRWVGRKARSTSQQFSGNTMRTNWCTNPTLLVDSGAYRGQNAKIGREKTNVLGPAYVLKVTPNDTRNVVTGVTVYMNVPQGTEFDFTFMIQSLGGAISMKLTGSGWEVVSGTGTFEATTTPTRVTIRLRATGATADAQTLRIARVTNTNMRSFRISQVGLIDGTGSYFDGSTAGAGNPPRVTSPWEVTVGGVAPEDTASARLVLSTLGTGPTLTGDQYLFDQILFTQADAPVDTDPTDEVDPVPVMPAYFDGDTPTTFSKFDAVSLTATTARKRVSLTAEAPNGAVTAEIAVTRSNSVSPAVGDVIFADNLFLSPYTSDDEIPPYTAITLRDAVSEWERHFQDVYPIAGPTIIDSWEFGDQGCNGAAAQVEFSLVAENPTRLRDNGDVVALPKPTDVSGTTGAGAFAKIEDRSGIIRNYMPQFALGSPIIPNGWVVNTTAGSTEVLGIQTDPDGGLPYVMSVRGGPSTTAWESTISAISVLGERGGFDSAVASIWIGTNVSRSLTVRLTAYNRRAVVATQTKTITPPTTGTGNIFGDTFRVDFNLGAMNADGFRFTITGPTGTVTTYIANPQVTLGSTSFPLLNGVLPDDGTYTYDFDAAGFSRRTPVKRVESHTIFANLTTPPVAVTGLSGYDEVGLTTYRTYAAIPADIVPRNAFAVPVARVDFDRYLTRWVRFRFYPNPNNLAPEKIDTSTFEAEWVIDQFSGNVQRPTDATGYMSIVIDGVARRVWARAQDGTVIPGDQYVVTSEGSPIQWPELRSIPYVVSVEYPTFKQANEPTGENWWRASLGLMIEEL